eukprot:TRINITY_DN6069_c0_g1_i1.p2 TRINITY_DN6069_c0_g1~~TRINITY_DN6069_c0_g1_i1.p2  ORF type:complete len:111 (+),score=56.75 TRINITY_DN6069_c0_g1_i1:58-390(+)
MVKNDELACTYAALILHDEGSEVSADKINEVCKAAGVEVEPFYPTLFANFLKKKPLKDLLSNVGACAAGPAVAAPAAGGGGGGGGAKAEAKAPPPKEESEEEETDFGLFD